MTTGGLITWKTLPDRALRPCRPTTLNLPLVWRLPMITSKKSWARPLILSLRPLSFTLSVASKFCPLMRTVTPRLPWGGTKPETTGGALMTSRRPLEKATTPGPRRMPMRLGEAPAAILTSTRWGLNETTGSTTAPRTNLSVGRKWCP